MFTFEEKLKYVFSHIKYLHTTGFFFVISDWCAILYEHKDFKGWSKVIRVTSLLDLGGTIYDNAITSVRVRPGDSCILGLYEHWGVGLLESRTDDDKELNDDKNDKVSSVSCTCQP